MLSFQGLQGSDMDRRTNPFNELYVTETVSSSAYVRIFSPSILRNASALFLPGNVVIKGMQGCGKSMLLSLLKPEVRLAYAEAKEDFPLEGKYSKFIGAGINLTRSGSIDFGQRQMEDVHGDESLPVYFGDFLNFWIAYDVLSSILTYSEKCDGAIAAELGLDCSSSRLDAFAVQLKTARCWFGCLDDVQSFSDLRAALSTRINAYLNYLNFNSSDLPVAIRNSKTTVGEPIAQVAEHLRNAGIVPEDVHLIVRIDQYEELTRLEGKRAEYGSMFREVVNKALSLRNPHVSYRIGTRGYAWSDNPRVYGTVGHLEKDRNYKLIDLDEMLRRRENPKTWIFPAFAEDVFRKRLLFAAYTDVPSAKAVEGVFGAGVPAENRARQYAGKAPLRAVKFDKAWPAKWTQYLENLAMKDPLSARLGEAWARQKGKQQIVDEEPAEIPVWNSHKYWRKERVEAALMQIAGRCGQRMIWAGADDLIELSGGNILVFVSICQHIWAAWLRVARGERASNGSVPSIDEAIQAVGIQEASTHWYTKVAEESGGTSRQRFISTVGETLEKSLYNDDALSYPGRNGFSLSLSDLKQDVELEDFLNECVDYGALFDAPHTTKESNRRPRRKWYLNPILSPYFKLPHIHTKEPAYLTGDTVRGWLYAAQVRQSPRLAVLPVKAQQAMLFEEESNS
jgi:hypothetical protein